MTDSISNQRTPRDLVIEYANRIISKLDCDNQLRKEVESIIESADNRNLLTSGNPKHLAAGIVYIAGILAEDRMTLATVGSVIGASGSTVGKHFMLIARGLGFSER